MYLPVFIQNLLVHFAEKILLMPPLTCGMDYQSPDLRPKPEDFTSPVPPVGYFCEDDGVFDRTLERGRALLYAASQDRSLPMSLNTFGHLFRVTTWGESHGPALGATVDGCPPGVVLEAAMIQHWLDRRRPGQSKFTTQRREPDAVRILSGVYEARTTGTPIQLTIENTDQRSKDYGEIAQSFRPGHADITYWQKYGLRDPRGGGRSSARETAARVAAGGVAREVLKLLAPGITVQGYMVQMGDRKSVV